MKIGQFSDSFLPIVDGVGRVVYNYCDTIASKGHEVSAIVPCQDMGYRGRFNFEIIDYYSKSLKVRPEYDAGLPPFDLNYHQKLSYKNFDIVHVHTPFIAGIEGIKYAKEHNIPLVGTFHSKYYDDFLQLTGSELLARKATDVVVDFYNRLDEVWAVSKQSADTLNSYGYQKEVKVMPNGMKIKKSDPNNYLIVKEKFHINDDPCLLFVGQMNFKKNILRILEAASLLKKEGVRFNIILVGKGPHTNDIKQKIKELDIEDVSHVLGHQNDDVILSGLYQLADLFVFPSLYDNAPMVVREAALEGTPSIVVGQSSASEVINNGVNGFYCLDDSESLKNVIKNALKYKENTKRIGLMAKDSIPIAWDLIIDEVIERYEYLIDLKKR